MRAKLPRMASNVPARFKAPSSPMQVPVLVLVLAVACLAASCGGADTTASSGAGSTATSPGSTGTVAQVLTATVPVQGLGNTTAAPPSTTAAPVLKGPPPTPKPAPSTTKHATTTANGPTTTLKPLTPTCGAIKVFQLIYFSAAGINLKKADAAKLKAAIIALDDSAIAAQKAVPALAADIKVLHDSQLNRLDGKGPDVAGLADASNNIRDWNKANC